MPKNSKKTNKNLPSRIFVVEDHPVFREGLVRLINAEADMKVCGEAESAEKALAAIKRLKPDLSVVDLELPGKNGIELIKQVRKSKTEVKLLVVSMYDEALYANRVLTAGGDGYIMKQENPEEIIDAIRDVLAGHVYVSEEVFAAISNTTTKHAAKPKTSLLDQLSDNELNVMEQLARGKGNVDIARQLQLPLRKIASVMVQMRKKLKLDSHNALVRYAVCWAEAGTA